MRGRKIKVILLGIDDGIVNLKALRERDNENYMNLWVVIYDLN